MRRVLIFLGLKVVEVGAALGVWVGAALIGQYTWLPYFQMGTATDMWDMWAAKWFLVPLYTLLIPLLVITVLGVLYCGMIVPNWRKAGELETRRRRSALDPAQAEEAMRQFNEQHFPISMEDPRGEQETLPDEPR